MRCHDICFPAINDSRSTSYYVTYLYVGTTGHAYEQRFFTQEPLPAADRDYHPYSIKTRTPAPTPREGRHYKLNSGINNEALKYSQGHPVDLSIGESPYWVRHWTEYLSRVRA